MLSFHRMASAAAVLGLVVLGLGSPAAAHPPPGPFPTRPPLSPSASPSPSPSAGLTPTITLGFDDGTDDQLSVARFLGQRGLAGVFYVNSGRLNNPTYLTLDQVRQIQNGGHEIGGHTVFHLRLSEQDGTEQKRAVCVDRNQLLAAGIQATSFAYPFGDVGPGTAALAPACGYQSARLIDGIGCPGCPAAESAADGDRFRSRALSGFGPETTAADLQRAVERTLGTDGWLQMAFHRICTTACAGDSVRAAEFAPFIDWLAGQRATGAIRNATVRQALLASVLPAVTPPRATATAVAFQNNSFEQPGPAGDAPPRCFTYGGLAVPTWSRVTDSHGGRTALRAVVTPAAAGSRMLTTQDLGSCAPPIRAGAHYRVGFWYKATQPIKTTTYARRALGGYRAFGPATTFPASRTWSLASWTIGPAPAGGTALSLGVSLGAPGVYTFDDFALAGVAARRPEQRTAAVRPARERPAATARSSARPATQPAGRRAAQPAGRPAAQLNPSHAPGAAFVPPDLTPQLPEAAAQPAGNDLTGPPAWLGYGEIAGAVLLTFAAVVILDRRFRHLHRRTRLRLPRERRNGLAS